MLTESMNKDIFELEQLFKWSQETLFRVNKLWFSLQAFLATIMCQLTAQGMVAHMLPELKAPMLHTCRSCVTATGSIVLVCFGGGLVACDLPVFQPVQAVSFSPWSPVI